MYLALITSSLFLVFGSSATMSVLGLISVFSSNSAIIFCLASGMEIGKILTISHLYRNWPKINQIEKTGYIFIIAILTFLTSIEVMGFLSQSHQNSTHQNQIILAKINALHIEGAELKNQINAINTTLKGLPDSYVSKKFKNREQSGYDNKQDRILEIIQSKAQFETQLISEQTKSSPVYAVAQVIGMDESQIITIFIILLVLILEPLTIGLTVATNAAWLSYSRSKKRSLETIPIKKNNSEELKRLQKEHNLSTSQIAQITGRKKIKTIEGWLSGGIHTPSRALIEIKTWIKKKK